MGVVACPACGETDRLSGTRRPDHTLEITCLACGAVWERDATRRCNACGSTDLEYAPRALWAKGRGDQRTPAGRIDAYSCRHCGAHDVTATRRPAAPGDQHAPGLAPAARTGGGDSVPAAPSPPPLGEPPARRLLELQRMDAEIDRLRARVRRPPEQRHADASAAELSKVAKTVMALVGEWQRLQAAGPRPSAAAAQEAQRVQDALAAARSRGEELAARHRRQLAAVSDAAAAVATALKRTTALRDRLAGTLEPLLEPYESVRRRVRDPVALVVDIGTCGGCRIVIPPSELERAREVAGTDLAGCPGCGRFLVFEA